MPIARFEMPDGRIGRFEVPEGTTPEQAQAMISQSLQRQQTGREYRGTAEEDSPATNFIAGVGGMMKAPVIGIRQLLGKTEPGEVEDWADSMKGLTGTMGGQLGAMTGAAVVPAAVASTLPAGVGGTVLGALGIGAASGAAEPITQGQTRLGNATKGALFNAALPIAVVGGTAIKRGIIDPFRQGGQEQIAGRVLDRFASDPVAAIASAKGAPQYVPGSKPTLGEATLDPGLATLQETLRSIDPVLTKAALVNRGNQNSAARLDVLRNVAGTGGKYEAAVAARGAAGKQNYGAAFDAGIDQEAAAAFAPLIENLTQRIPSAIIDEAKNLSKMAGKEFGDTGSVEGLHYVKLALDTRIANAKGPEKSILTHLKNDYMGTLEEISPLYKKAVDEYAKASKPINAMDVGRKLYDKSTNALMEGSEAQRLYPNAYARQLQDETRLVKDSTGKSGSLRSVLPDDDIKALNAVKKDLQRQVRAQDLAKVNGSPTAQYLVGQDILRQTIGPIGMPKGVAESSFAQNFLNRPVSLLYGVPEQRVRGLLAQTLTDPQMASGLLSKAQSPLLGDVVMNSRPYGLLAPSLGYGIGMSQF